MFKKLIFVLFVSLLTGCTSKFAYNNADWLIHWYIDDFIELTDQQETRFDIQMAKWLEWHRKEELVVYKSHLLEIKSDVESDSLTKETIANHLNTGKSHLERLRAKVSPQIAELALTLDDEQVTYLFAALEKENKKHEKDLNKRREGTKEEQLEKRIESITDDLEAEIGRLTDQQNVIINDYASKFHATGDDWIAYRRNIQNEARKLFLNKDEGDNFVQSLLFLMTNPDHYREADYAANREDNKQLFLLLLTDLAPTMTTKQKSKLIDKIDDIIADINDLMDK